MKNILVITAHPDDLEMSCGGTVAKWVSEGHRVINLVLVASVSHAEFLPAAQKHLGYEVVAVPANRERLSITPDLIADLESHFADTPFDKIVTHWKEDWHQEHQLCYDLGRILARKQPCDLWYMSSHPYHLKYQEFSPDIYVDISSHVHLKHKAMGEYKNITDQWGIGVKSHDSWRGSFIGVKKAEVFQAGHIIL
jgi:LmbE family N-acetylglucosaminyl deacetylase